MLTPVILSGGVGSRLWPLSRGMYPKQLLNLVHRELSMLQQTVLRLPMSESIAAPCIVCNEEHRFMVGEQLNQIGVDSAEIMLEPEGKNTAPAIALAAARIVERAPDSVMLVMPADHVIADTAGFRAAVDLAMQEAKDGSIVTFGIVPQHAETGYGYIQAHADQAEEVLDVVSFHEKPDQNTAKRFLDAGNYFWNGGIFIATPETLLSELQRYAPDVVVAAKKAVANASLDMDFIRVDGDAFSTSPSISIDYAVMEKTDKAKVIALDVGWNDVGSWSALSDVSDKDEAGNSLIGDVLIHDTRNSFLYGESKLVSAVGVDNLVVVETADAILVANKDKAQNVKEIVSQLVDAQREQVNHHRKVYRPWGWYDSIDIGPRFQVKRIQVKPGARLSVQMHYHRAEHWVVVSGTAEVLNGNETILLGENESTYIPIGTTHALRNPSDSQPLEIIEVQSGSYLGEDDIVRFEDNYGRAKKESSD